MMSPTPWVTPIPSALGVVRVPGHRALESHFPSPDDLKHRRAGAELLVRLRLAQGRNYLTAHDVTLRNTTKNVLSVVNWTSSMKFAFLIMNLAIQASTRWVTSFLASAGYSDSQFLMDEQVVAVWTR
jgi:hypothetical protein